jgi:hypothetical protein
MLKGKTTIQLFDAKTGKLTDEVTKTNLVTSAVRNALGGAFNQLASGNMWADGMRYINSLYSSPKGKNFAQALYGGVLVFSKPITEDVDHCLPSIEEIKTFIGCANQSASNTGNSFRGSINSGESEVGKDYVKFVWDFNTDQCNGDIASICLTSDCGGAVGYGCDAKAAALEGLSLRDFYSNNFWDASKAADLNYNTNGALVNAEGWGGSDGKCAYIDGDYLHVIYRGRDNKQSIANVTSKAKFGLSLVDGFNYGNITSSEVIDTGIAAYKDIPYTAKDHGFCQDGDGSYEEFKLIKYSGNGVAERVTIPASNINSAIFAYFGQTGKNSCLNSQDKIIHNDKLYIITGQLNWADLTTHPNKLRVWILNFDGTFTFKDIAVTSKMATLLAGTDKKGGYYDTGLGGTLRYYRGSLAYIAPDGTNGYAWFLLDNDGTMQTSAFMLDNNIRLHSNYCLVDNADLIPNPYIEMNMHSNSSNLSLYVPLLVSAYLGTINNQETVLTKTADKTMKIIYTLTQS